MTLVACGNLETRGCFRESLCNSFRSLVHGARLHKRQPRIVLEEHIYSGNWLQDELTMNEKAAANLSDVEYWCIQHLTFSEGRIIETCQQVHRRTLSLRAFIRGIRKSAEYHAMRSVSSHALRPCLREGQHVLLLHGASGLGDCKKGPEEPDALDEWAPLPHLRPDITSL